MSTDGKTRPLGNQRCPTAYLLFDFEKGSFALKSEHRRLLTTIARILRGNRGALRNRDVPELPAVKLVGRASRSGSEASNLRLSEKRVEEVAQFLRNQGVLPAQIEFRGIGEAAPFSSAQESEDDRSVEVHLKVPRMLRVFLAHADRVRPTPVLFQVIREAFEPVFRAADRELNLVSAGSTIGDADVGIVFERESRAFLGREPNRRFAFQIMGNEDGTVDLAQFEELRVGSFLQHGAGARRDPDNPRQIDHVFQTEPLFQNGEREFAHAVANTAVHEIAHQLGLGQHSSDPFNFMSGIQFPPLDARSRSLLRNMIVGPKHFTSEQIETLACAVRRGAFRGVELE